MNRKTIFYDGTLPQTDRELYLDYFNNFLTVERFAEYYGMTVADAKDLIQTEKEKEK